MIDEEMRLLVVARAKIELRKRLRALRHTTPAAALAKRSARIAENLCKESAIQTAKRVALFWPIEERHEVDLRPLDTWLRARGAEVAYPCIGPQLQRVRADGDEVETPTMTFRFASPEDLVIESLGFRGAPPTAPEAAELDVIVVPAIALDASGNRLGYGAGFYDRALARFESAIKIGVAYDFQLLVEVPVNTEDVAMNVVITDTRILRA